MFFRSSIFSGFNVISGDIGDNRFIIVILEHWLRFLRGHEALDSPLFFWPEHGVLGYSESLFLFSLPYSLFREIGADRYVSFELTLIIFKAVGFFSLQWLLRSFMRVTRVVAVIGSALFTVTNQYYVTVGHAQLIMVAFVPLLVCLAWMSLREFKQRPRVSYVYAGTFSLLLALVLFTSFYVGWFFIFTLFLALVIRVTSRLFGRKGISTENGRTLREMIIARRSLLTVGATIFFIGLAPFLIVYLAKLKSTGGRSFEENLIYSLQPSDLLNVGPENMIWGKAIGSAVQVMTGSPLRPGEYEVGWPPLTLLSFFLALTFALVSRKTRGGETGIDNSAMASLFGLTVCAGLLLSLKIGGSSLWWFVFKLFPGGSAIRVPARFNIVLNVLVVLTICLGLDRMRLNRSAVLRMCFIFVAIALLAEQITNVPSSSIDRQKELTITAKVGEPPSVCRSFFLAYPSSPVRPWYANQIDAMWLAEEFGLPTLNGYSGWVPPGWGLNLLDNTYFQAVRNWVVNNDLSKGLCELDLRSGAWSVSSAALSHPGPYWFGEVIDFRTNGNAGEFEIRGWGRAEPGGSWALGDDSVLRMRVPPHPNSDLLLSFTAHAYLPSSRRRFYEVVKVKNQEVARWAVGEPKVDKVIVLPRDVAVGSDLEIKFSNTDSRSPAELEKSADIRKLGLALETLRIDQAEPKAPNL